MKPLVYWAGPYSGDVENNIRRAQLWACAINRTGLVYAVLPHVFSHGIEASLSEADWREMTLELSRRCDGLLMDPAFHESDGSVGEFNAAIVEHRPVVIAQSIEKIEDSVRALLIEIEGFRALRRVGAIGGDS